MKQRTLGIGIIGAGNIIKRHATAYKCLPELARLVGVADIDAGRARKAKRTFGFADAYQDHRELLARDDVDAVSVCTPANHHASIVIDALNAGKHVLCEKPMASTLAEADKIMTVAGRNPNAKASFVFQWRSEPAHARIRKMIRQGLFGRLLMATVRVRAKRAPAYYAAVPGRGSWKSDGGGVLINQAIHQLDALVSFLGNPVEVSAAMDTFVQPTEGEDTLVAWIRFESGAIATLDCTVCSHDEWFAIDVLGENASSALSGGLDAHWCKWELTSKSAAAQRALTKTGHRLCPSVPEGPGVWTVRAQKIKCKLTKKEWLPPRHWGHTPHVREFLMALQQERQVPVPPQDARRSLELAVALYAAALTKAPVTLPIDAQHVFYDGVDPQKIQAQAPQSQAVCAQG